MRRACCWFLAIACASAFASSPTSTLLRPQVDIGGSSLVLDVRVTPAGAGTQGTMRADVDLSPVIAQVREVIASRLPRDPCRRHAADNWVAGLRRYVAWVEGDELWFEVELRVEAWACVEIRRNELRRRLAEGDVRLRLPLRAQASDDGLRLRVGRPEVGVRGPLGDAARWYFALRGEELGEALARRAARLDARGLLLPGPAEWLGKGQLDDARFIDAGRPSLRLQLRWTPTLPGWFDRVWPWGRNSNGQ